MVNISAITYIGNFAIYVSEVEKISIEEISEMAHSFNYEFVCDINRRVPRVYYRDGEVVDIVNYLR